MFQRIIYTSLASLFFVSNAFAVNVDYNVNGFTDFHLYGTNNNKTNIDHGIFLDDGQTASLTFGNAKNEKMALGDYDGDNKCDIGIVKKNKGDVIWQYKSLSQNNVSEAKKFGTGKIRVLTGCDFNGNGKTDMAYIDGKTLYYKDFSSKKKKINLPRSGYEYIYCADVTGNGKDEFIGKKKGVGIINGKKEKNVWSYDVVTIKSKSKLKKKVFGERVQGDIIAHDINGDGKNEIGYIKKHDEYTYITFLNSLSGNDVTTFVLPREIKKTNEKFDINKGYFKEGIGFIYKGKDENVYKYSVDTETRRGVDTTFIFAVNTPKNLKNGTLARDINDFTINAGSGGNNGSNNNDVTKAGCDVMRGTGNGFLWKGRGDAYGGVSVAVLPIYTKASSCSIVAADNSESGSMWCSSQSANPWNGVGRQHWRARALCSAYKKPSILKCKVGTQWQCWNIANPCQSRIE